MHPDNLHQVEEQEKRIPWIPQKYFVPIFEQAITSNAAVEIVDALADYFEKPAYMKYDVPYSVVASDLELASGSSLPISPTGPKSSWKDAPRSSKTSRTIHQLRPAPTTLQEASAARAAIAASTSYSFASASSAFRKGRSDPLMRQAAAYYADRGHLEAANHRQAISMEANMLVDKRSTKDKIDLHGVSVQDGIEITIDRVWRWWDGLGEEKTRKATQNGLTIITGLGRHNSDGKSPLRINVFKALMTDGWKFEVLTGAFLITGRR
ncbi:hypothetical protein GGR50DRAFT_247576 [Xylaria sp. CBS 124048]|nr:hypothetical protein GGR50DRAFT_247576 [Xylaria sp. CBS 124048]